MLPNNASSYVPPRTMSTSPGRKQESAAEIVFKGVPTAFASSHVRLSSPLGDTKNVSPVAIPETPDGASRDMAATPKTLVRNTLLNVAPVTPGNAILAAV